MTDRRALNPRYAAAQQALGVYFRLYDTTEERTDRLLADLRHLLGSDTAFQDAVDASRLIAHGEAVAVGEVSPGAGPRADVWRQRLEADRIGGAYWTDWHPDVKDVLVQRCVDIEHLSMREQLEALAEKSGTRAVWNPQTGAVEPPGVLAGHDERQARIAAYRAALDQYHEVENEVFQTFAEAQTQRLARLGYRVEPDERRSPLHHGTIEIDTVAGLVTVTSPDPLEPIRADDARVLADLITAADALPPIQVDIEDLGDRSAGRRSWARAAARHVLIGEDKYFLYRDPPTQDDLLVDVTNAQTRAINGALPQGWVWDPRPGFPVPLPGTDPAPLGPSDWAAINQAKWIDAAAIVHDVVGPDAFKVRPHLTRWEVAANRVRDAVNIIRGRASAMPSVYWAPGAPTVPYVGADAPSPAPSAGPATPGAATASASASAAAAAVAAIAFPADAPATSVDTAPTAAPQPDDPQPEVQR